MSASEERRDATADASDQGEGGSRPATRKDRACPFCKQPFTSSSLGRHLDLYIKDQNSKAPDGVHDIAKIKEMRRGITRRHARSGTHAASSGTSTTNKRSHRIASGSIASRQPSPHLVSTPAHINQPSTPATHSPAVSGHDFTPAVIPSHHARPPKQSVPAPMFNRMNWQATGVINNLPPRPSSSLSRELPRPDLVRGHQDLAHGGSFEERENAHAAELALKEVLERIQTARSRSAKDLLFDFDPLTLSFPALCLRILPASTTLFSTLPIETAESCPLGVPGNDAYDAVARIMIEGLAHASELHGISQGEQPYIIHLNRVYHQFMTLSNIDKERIWHIELHRHLRTANTSLQAATASMQHLQHENEQLRAQIERLREAPSMQPWQRPLFPPPPPPLAIPRLSPDLFKELIETTEDRSWDYEVLIDKWKRHVKNIKGPLGTTAFHSKDASQPSWSAAQSPATNPVPRLDAKESNSRYATLPALSAFGHPGMPPQHVNGGSSFVLPMMDPSGANRTTGMRIAELVNAHADSNWRGVKRARTSSLERGEDVDDSGEDNEDSLSEDGANGEEEEQTNYPRQDGQAVKIPKRIGD